MAGLDDGENITNYKVSQAHTDLSNKLLKEIAFPEAAKKGVSKGEASFLHKDGHEIPTAMFLMRTNPPLAK